MFLLAQFRANVSHLYEGIPKISERRAGKHTQKPGQTVTRKSSQTFALAANSQENKKKYREDSPGIRPELMEQPS